MKHKNWWQISHSSKTLLIGCLIPLVVACSSKAIRQPVEMQVDPMLLQPTVEWQKNLGKLDYPISVQTNAKQTIAIAAANGTVELLNGQGALIWSHKLAHKIRAAAGNDGDNVAVVTETNQLIVLNNGKQLWSADLPDATYSAPLVLAGRVFLSSAENTILAYDLTNGSPIWRYNYRGSNLSLKASLNLRAYNNQLLIGESGVLTALDSITGVQLWSVALNELDFPANELAKVQLLLAQSTRSNNQLCLNLYDTNTSCVDLDKKVVLWSSPLKSYYGLTGDAENIYVADKEGVVHAIKRDSFAPFWENKDLLYHQLLQPVVVKNILIISDSEGWLHFVNKQDGKLLRRLRLDSSSVIALWPVADNSILAFSAKGTVKKISLN